MLKLLSEIKSLNFLSISLKSFFPLLLSYITSHILIIISYFYPQKKFTPKFNNEFDKINKIVYNIVNK